MASFDLVGLVDRFDETLILLADLTGLQARCDTRSLQTQAHTGSHSQQLSFF